MKIAIGNDRAGFQLKEFIRDKLRQQGIQIEDFGCHYPTPHDYPVYALKVAKRVALEEFDYGILICGTGIGMSVSANKIKGVRAALCSNTQYAELSRRHNNANALCLGGRMTEPYIALEIVKKFISTPFDGDTPAGQRHKRRVEMIDSIEN